MHYSNIFSRLWNASRYSLCGLIYALKHEQAFRYEAAVMAIILAVILIVHVPVQLSLMIIFAWAFVMCLELINSSVEKAFRRCRHKMLSHINTQQIWTDAL